MDTTRRRRRPICRKIIAIATIAITLSLAAAAMLSSCATLDVKPMLNGARIGFFTAANTDECELVLQSAQGAVMSIGVPDFFCNSFVGGTWLQIYGDGQRIDSIKILGGFPTVPLDTIRPPSR